MPDTTDNTTIKEHLPHLRKLLSNNSNQEARSWVSQVKFEAQGFKDSAKFFMPSYCDFNPTAGIQQHNIWVRGNPHAVPPMQSGFIPRPTAGPTAYVEPDVVFADRIKRYYENIQTHSNLRYAMIRKMPDHIASFVKDEANAHLFLNVQDICEYIIRTYDSTSGVSTQDTWSEQYAKLKNKNRKNASSFTEFFNEQQRLANIYKELTLSYQNVEVRAYRDRELLERTMQLYRKNLPIHEHNSDTSDRFHKFRQDINVTHGTPPYASYDDLNNGLRASYQIWVNDVKHDQPKEDNPSSKNGKGKKKRESNDEGENGKPSKEKKLICPVHPNGKHSANECRDLIAFYEQRKENSKDKPIPKADKKNGDPKGKARIDKEKKKTRFETNSITFFLCQICKDAG